MDTFHAILRHPVIFRTSIWETLHIISGHQTLYWGHPTSYRGTHGNILWDSNFGTLCIIFWDILHHMDTMHFTFGHIAFYFGTLCIFKGHPVFHNGKHWIILWTPYFIFWDTLHYILGHPTLYFRTICIIFWDTLHYILGHFTFNFGTSCILFINTIHFPLGHILFRDTLYFILGHNESLYFGTPCIIVWDTLH